MSDTCHICKSTKIVHYRQIRRDGVTVVTARCENCHIPVKGKPFYPIYLFKLNELPLLVGEEEKPVTQMTFTQATPAPVEPQKKYPRMPMPKPSGINIPLPIENDDE